MPRLLTMRLLFGPQDEVLEALRNGLVIAKLGRVGALEGVVDIVALVCAGHGVRETVLL